MKKIKPSLIDSIAKNLALLSLVILSAGLQTGYAQCAGNTTPPVVSCVPNVLLDVLPGGSRTVDAAVFDAGTYDDCTASNNLQFFIETGTPSPTPPATTQMEFTDAQAGNYTLVLWAVDEQGNAAFCTTDLEVAVCQTTPALACNDQVIISLDANYSAEVDAFDMLEGGPYCNYNTYAVRLGQAGDFTPELTVGPGDIGSHLMSVVDNAGNVCWGTLIVLPGVLAEDCPLMYVDIAANAIRPCTSNNYYVSYINASTQTISDTYIDVALDSRLLFEASELPAIDQGNNVYRFETGTLSPGQIGSFWLQFFADCDEPVGTTYCSTAGIFPDTICPGILPWSGAEVAVEGVCNNDTVFLTVKNIGTAANAQVLDYVVVEDVLMRESGTFSLGNGQAMALDPIAANGATIRLEATQEPGFPYGGRPSVAIEGCGGFTPGLVTQFPNELSDPFHSRDCRQSTASFDPNDKQALPKGVGADHLIENTTTLDYMIRFQNTGTDTAFRVVLVDTLSAFLDASRIRPGASSHLYNWKLLPGNILQFTFENILLPDSNANEAASHGFVQFSIPQIPDNPDGIRIENSAAIYFDFNAPVLTNQTVHTIGSHFIVVSTDDPTEGHSALRVYPNPAVDIVYFDVAELTRQGFRFELINALGSTVRQLKDVTLPLSLNCAELPPGTYFFRLAGAGGTAAWSGKLLVR